MYILGINTRLNASVVLMKDNEVIFGAQEERYTKIKNQPGFPVNAIQVALEHAGITAQELDKVCVESTTLNYFAESRQDDLNKFHDRYQVIKDKWFGKKGNSVTDIGKKIMHRLGSRQQEAEPRKSIDDYLAEYSLDKKLERFDHQTCHAAAAYYGLAERKDEKYLVFSLDGGGDGKTSAVFIGHNNKLQEIASSNSFSPACLYAHITYILGFLPHEHEYKLMGLAPYAQPQYAQKAKDILSAFVGFDKSNPLIFTNTENYPEVQNSGGAAKQELIEDLFKSTLNLRFDTLSAGLQMLTEELAVQWIKEGVKQTGIKRVLLSGGFFMNVKANKLISELPEVEFVNCFPSCGDETNAFGAAFLGYEATKTETDKDINFDDFCLGTSASFDIEKAKETLSDKVSFRKSDDINSEIAQMLYDRKIVARCSGKMEFGARALGNRSILASPDDVRIINKINSAIKKRDFWMPFAPAVLEDKAETLMDIPDSIKEISSPYMMFTFLTKKEKAEQIIAGVHQTDRTARGQLVNRKIYPDFYEIINNFYEKSGVPAVLNTSFNLHGFPIVLGACDAIDVYLNSDLDILVVDDYVITRKNSL